MNEPTHAFSQNFSPDDLKGYVAQHHKKRDDIFQQLVGALLQFQYQHNAHVSTTKGNDGSIDIYVDVNASIASGLCAHLAGPIIIECKDHEEGSNTAKNIHHGWAEVEKKLRKQASTGWQGHFSPWLRTKSYLYCVSPNITQSLRDELQGKIETFFHTLPEQSRPAIEQVMVIDWSDLRPHLNSNSKLIDAWLGINHSNITGHQELLSGFSGFRSLLREEELRFIELDKNALFNPHRIHEKLESLDTPKGVLLKGVGGIGKSRTAIEVAALAEKTGWHVLHILPGEPAVTAEDIEELLAIDNNDTLLVFDYIEQATLDFQTLFQRVLSKAHGRGQRVRLLATARPNTLKPNPPRDQLFETLEMVMDGDQQQRLTQTLVPLVAPIAIDTLGREPILRVCGHRPIIAVIIARDLERLVRENRLNAEQLRVSPPGDLLTRLRAQLDDHQLTANPESSGGLLPDPPKPDLILAATILAATPFNESLLAETISSAVEGDGDIARSQRILTHLKTLGWLDIMGNSLYSAHDVVADEMLQRVFWDTGTQTIYTEQFQQLLTPLLGSARLLGRFAIAFSRLQEGPFREAVASASARWLAQHAEALGNCWADSPADESAYAIGAALDYPEWADQLALHWESFIQPWLSHHSEELAARHLLYRGLKALPGGEGQQLIVSAAHWLARHHLQTEASYVLAPLLGREDLGIHASDVIDLAMDWLNHEDHAHSPEAGFVLPPLLGREDLGIHASDVIDLAMSWLKHGEQAHSSEAEFVLHPLLGREDLGIHASDVIDLAMAWLKHGEQAHSPEARFVLHPLLGREDLGIHASDVIDLAMVWLKHGEQAHSPEAGFVLPQLLGREDLGIHASDVIDLAIAWLKHEDHAHSPEAGFVLHPLLGREDLGAQAPAAIDLAIDWLNHEDHVRAPEAQFVLLPLLGREDLGTQAPAAIDLAIYWLNHEDHAHATGADFVLRTLLGRKDLTESQHTTVRGQAIDWLTLFPDGGESSFILTALLIDKQSSEGEERVFNIALLWLDTHHNNADAEFVLKRLLRQRSLGDGQWRQALGYAIDWLTRYTKHDEYPYVLSDTLIRGHCLDAEQRNRLSKEAEALLSNPSKLSQRTISALRARLEAIKSGKPPQNTQQLSEELSRLACSTEIPNKELLQQGLAAVQQRLEHNSPASAGYFISALLVLSHRVGDEELRTSILATAKKVVSHPEMQPKNINGMRSNAIALLGKKAWPTTEHGRADLRAVGLLE